MLENKNNFSIINVKNKHNLSKLRWTVDYPEDLEFVRKIYEKLYSKNSFFGMDEILNLLSINPKIAKINEKYSSKTGIESFNSLKKKNLKT